jgi:predicted TIM-barrel fold metal-dependent hydrolase
MHAGVPIFMEETFAMMFMYRNLYVDISALAWYDIYGKLSLDEFLKKACSYGFGGRIMFGSDEMAWPGAIGLSIEYIENAEFLTDKQRRDILYNNAAKFLRLTEDEINKHFQNNE